MSERNTRDKIKISRINGIFHSLFLTGLDYALGIFARIIWVSSNLFARLPCKSILFSLSLSSSLPCFILITHSLSKSYSRSIKIAETALPHHGKNITKINRDSSIRNVIWIKRNRKTLCVQEFVFCLEKKMNFKKIKKRLSFKEKLKN